MRLTHYPFTEHPAGGHDQGRNDRDEKLHDGDVECRTTHKSKSDKEEK